MSEIARLGRTNWKTLALFEILYKALSMLIALPHISWAAQASRQRIMDITADNLRAFLAGNPVNVVNS